jgi:hypothetical protein
MMFNGVRGALAADDALSDLGRSASFASGRPRSGKCTRCILKLKGRKIRRCCSLRDDPGESAAASQGQLTPEQQSQLAAA